MSNSTSNSSNGSRKKHKAIALFQGNLVEKARPLIKDYCKHNKTDAEAWMLWGMVEARLGDFGVAVKCFQNLVQIAPLNPDSHYYLGAAHEAANRLDDALHCYQEALRLDAMHVKSMANSGNVYRKRGSMEAAESAYRKTLDLRPDNVDALCNLGVVLKEQAKWEEALVCFKRALSMRPDSSDIHLSIANTYQMLGELDAAESSYRKTIMANPRSVDAYNGLSGVLYKNDRGDEAIEILVGASALMPDEPSLAASMADIHEKHGRYPEALQALTRFLTNGATDISIAVKFAALCKHVDRCEEAVERLENAIRQPGKSAYDLLQGHLALGRLYDRAGRFDQAFEHYSIGNRYKPLAFDADAHVAKINRIMDVYTREFVADAPKSACQAELPVFIVGMPRSGTSLLEQMLASHRQVFGAGELTDIPKLAVSTLPALTSGDQPYPECMRSVSAQLLTQEAGRYIDTLEKLGGDAARVTDKLPGNFMYLGLIGLLFPRARIIHCTRNPLDTCLSCYFQDFYGYHPYAYDLTSLGQYYREYLRIMKHWKAVSGVPIMDVSYERLVEDPEHVLRNVLEFCGLPWDPQCLEYSASGRKVETASYDQVRQPIYSGSVDRWKRYEKHLTALKRALNVDT